MCAVQIMAVSCSSLMCFTGILIGYILNDFAIVPVSPIITGITSVLTFYMSFVCSVLSLLLGFFLVHIYYYYYRRRYYYYYYYYY